MCTFKILTLNLKPHLKSQKTLKSHIKKFFISKEFLLKKLKKWKRSLLTYLEKRNCRKLSKVFRFCKGLKSRKVFKEKYVAKNAWDGVA